MSLIWHSIFSQCAPDVMYSSQHVLKMCTYACVVCVCFSACVVEFNNSLHNCNKSYYLDYMKVYYFIKIEIVLVSFYKMCTALWPSKLTTDDVNFLDDYQVYVDAAVATQDMLKHLLQFQLVEHGSFP